MFNNNYSIHSFQVTNLVSQVNILVSQVNTLVSQSVKLHTIDFLRYLLHFGTVSFEAHKMRSNIQFNISHPYTQLLLIIFSLYIYMILEKV